MTLFSRELLRSRSSWVALLEEKVRWNRKNDCANWLVSCSFVLFLARVRIVLLTNHEFQIEKYVNFGYFVKWKTEMNMLTLTMSAHGYITYTCLGWLTVKNKMVFGLVDRENKMYTWLVIPKKTGTSWIIFPVFSVFLGLKNWNVRCIWNVLLKMEKNTVVELGHNYETSELKPFLHQQWIYISEKNERGEIETKKI